MKIDEINPRFLEPSRSLMENSTGSASSFTHWLGKQITQTNETLVSADKALTELATGQTPNLHQTMLCLEQAKLSFHYLEQIRTRLMSAYQELLREQI